MRDTDIGPDVLMVKDAYGHLIPLEPCPKHPQYTAKRRPRLGPGRCKHCVGLYNAKHPEVSI
jgi:hypothetical protein